MLLLPFFVLKRVVDWCKAQNCINTKHYSLKRHILPRTPAAVQKQLWHNPSKTIYVAYMVEHNLFPELFLGEICS